MNESITTNPRTPLRDKTGRVYIEPAIRTIAGSMVLVLSALEYYSDGFSTVWLAGLIFLGFNLLQSSFSGFCLLEKMLKLFRLTSELDEIKALSRELKIKTDQQDAYLDTLNLLNEAVIELSPEWDILSATEGWARLVELDPTGDSSGQQLTRYVHENDRHLLTRLSGLLSRQVDQSIRINFRLNTMDGMEKWVSANFLLTEQGNDQIIKGVLADISQVRNLENEHRKVKQELGHARRLSSLGEMAAGLAHELNQPLAAINLYIQGCLQRLDTDSEQSSEISDAMRSASAQAKRAGSIIKQVRNFVRKVPLSQIPTDINILLKEATQLLDIDPGAQEAEFHYELENRLPSILLDQLQIKQVIVNLVQNAIEAANVPQDKKIVTLRTMTLKDSIAIEIEDNGIGVPEDISSQLFEPFITGRENGLGLGLTICQSIIEQHDGKLWYKGSHSKGSIFSFTLPIACQEEAHGKQDHSIYC